MKLKTKILSAVIAGIMAVTVFAGVLPKVVSDTGSEITVSAATFVPRTTEPSRSDPNYTTNNPYYPTYGMPNCTCYAYGRAMELLGHRPSLSRGNAYEWYGYNDGYSRGREPKLGAIACWNHSKGGHVAVVEKIDGNTVWLSESAWGGAYFNYFSLNKNNMGNCGIAGGYFQGYIYIGDWSDAVTPSKPNPVTAKEGYASMSTIFSWDPCPNATSYDLRIYTSSSLSSESRIDNFGSLIKVKDTSYSVSLPQGDYWITIASVNDTSGKYQFADSATKFTVKAPDNYLPKAVEKYNDHIYAFYDYATYYEDAEKISKQLSGHLVTISNKKENEAVANLIGKNKKSWMGLIRNKSGEFEWTDGTTLSYTNWSEGEPNNDGGAENYGVIYSGGTWNDSYTGMYTTGYFYGFSGFIVEYEPSDIKPTTTVVYNGHQ